MRRESVTLYGEVSSLPAVEWSWVDEQLTAAGTYWVVAPTMTHPHPRPVWGVWRENVLHLSIGSPALARQAAIDGAVTVHLDSGTDVVILEGRVSGFTEDADLITAYGTKYGNPYSVDEYGPLTSVRAERVLAYRSTGWAGSGGFQSASRFIP